MTGMDQVIAHVCGHSQLHYLHGFASQQDRKARWLETTKCRTCFAMDRQAEQLANVTRDDGTITHPALPQLSGSDRQIAWATKIRTERLSAILTEAAERHVKACTDCLSITEAKWWIDHRNLSTADLINKTQASPSLIDTKAVAALISDTCPTILVDSSS